MIIAGILFPIGILLGLYCTPVALVLASAVVASGMIALWLMLGSFSVFSILILFGYLAALQSGYLLGSYLAVRHAP